MAELRVRAIASAGVECNVICLCNGDVASEIAAGESAPMSYLDIAAEPSATGGSGQIAGQRDVDGPIDARDGEACVSEPQLGEGVVGTAS